MKNILRLLPVMLVFPFFLAAQFQKGAIRLSNGETLAGYIGHDTEVLLKRRIHFKESLGKTVYQVYSPNEIEGFFFEKGPSFETIQTSFKRENITFQEKAFAKVVAKGTIDLYLSQNDIEENEFVFYARKDGRLHQLKDREYAVNSAGYAYATQNYYQGIINALTFDCRKRIGNIEELPFSRKHIVETIDNYNACQDPDYTPLTNSYKVEKQKRYFVELFSGPIVARRNFGALTGNDRLILREVFVMLGIAGQIETYKPSLSRNLIVHNSLEAYKWVTWEETGIVNPPVLTAGYNMSAHYLFNERAKIRIFARIGGSFMLDIGRQILPSPGISLGFGSYFPNGARLDLHLNAISILGTEGVTSWRLGYAFPLASEWK